MHIDELMLIGYRMIAGVIAVVMALMIVRSDSWREQVFAALVFVPLSLRALGIK